MGPAGCISMVAIGAESLEHFRKARSGGANSLNASERESGTSFFEECSRKFRQRSGAATLEGKALAMLLDPLQVLHAGAETVPGESVLLTCGTFREVEDPGFEYEAPHPVFFPCEVLLGPLESKHPGRHFTQAVPRVAVRADVLQSGIELPSQQCRTAVPSVERGGNGFPVRDTTDDTVSDRQDAQAE